jgi:tetratricopeptide (TPR) repeat protein
MINIAAQYELQQRFDVAIKWYKIAIKRQPDLLDAYYGYALCQLKSGNIKSAIEHLSQAINLLGDVEITNKKQRHLIYFRYLRSLSFKISKDFQNSQNDYSSILPMLDFQESL